MVIKSAEHCTSNENGLEQITIDHNRTWLQWLFRKPAITITYVYKNNYWVNKATEKNVTHKEWFMLEYVETALRYDIVSGGRMKRGRSTRRHLKDIR